MDDLEKLFSKADFSKETDFKETLRGRLFSGGSLIEPFGKELSDEELGFVNAAGTTDNASGASGKKKDI
ncbi:MAG: hypothetical protein K6E95_08775 [Lachnospiraceae bacterium]|nr:hypothetical protein [Lachnospiraceae bacterium]